MAILMSLWEFFLVLIVFGALILFLSWLVWRRRMAHYQRAYDRARRADDRDMIREFRHQAYHCLRPIKDSLYLSKRSIRVVSDRGDLQQMLGDSLQVIEKYEWRLTRLIENMTLISRLEASDDDLRFSEVKLDVIVGDVVADFQDAAHEKGVILTWQAQPDPFPRITASEESLRQLLINLIDNAIKYCGCGDEIDVALTANVTRNILTIDVSDTGPGIPAEDLNLIFDKGYTVEGARGRKLQEGSQGLGLYIARVITEKHQGVIVASSQLGGGVTFVITLPLHRM